MSMWPYYLGLSLTLHLDRLNICRKVCANLMMWRPIVTVGCSICPVLSFLMYWNWTIRVIDIGPVQVASCLPVAPRSCIHRDCGESARLIAWQSSIISYQDCFHCRAAWTCNWFCVLASVNSFSILTLHCLTLVIIFRGQRLKRHILAAMLRYIEGVTDLQVWQLVFFALKSVSCPYYFFVCTHWPSW